MIGRAEPIEGTDRMTHDMLHVMEWHNGDKTSLAFSANEMRRRQDDVLRWMAANDVDAALFTSPHGIAYYSGWNYCGFGRKYGMVISPTAATTVSSGIDGGQPWRRGFGDNISYTDWRRDNYFCAVRQLTPGVRRLGVELDHIALTFLHQLEAALPGVELVDIGHASMWMRSIKSAEEHQLIRTGARISELGAEAAVAAIAAGVPEYEVANAATNAMQRAMAAAFPDVELMDSWTLFQSGINTDGAHNRATSKRIQSGEVLSLTCVPMLFGYATALERTLFCGHVDDASLDIWQKNLTVLRRGRDLIRPGARCSDIAQELNDLYRQWGLLEHRSGGYGQTVGLQSQHFGPDPGVALREDCPAELRPGMVISIEPMVMLPEGTLGAGGYREYDILIVTETGAETITRFPLGPDHNIIRANTGSQPPTVGYAKGPDVRPHLVPQGLAKA